MYVHCKSSLSNWFQIQNSRYLYKNSLVYFIVFTMGKTLFVFQVPQCSQCEQNLFHNLCSQCEQDFVITIPVHNVNKTFAILTTSVHNVNKVTLGHMLHYTWLILIACNDFMTYQGHMFLFKSSKNSPKIFLFFCQAFIPTVSVCLYQIDLMMYHWLLLFYLMIALVFIVQVGSFFL